MSGRACRTGHGELRVSKAVVASVRAGLESRSTRCRSCQWTTGSSGQTPPRPARRRPSVWGSRQC
eukprot:10896635-Lingulodinium_polyedra.AAC.1